MVKPTIDLSWKVGGTLYPKQTSRIGNEFQAVRIPLAGSYTEGAHADLYEVIYDPLNRHAASVIQALSEVPVNIKEQALTKFGIMATESANEVAFPDVTSAVSQLTPSDGSDWTSEQKETFHREIFRLRKDLTALSKLMGKDMKTCVTYYLRSFKKSDDYRILKVICAEERMDEIGENGSGVDSCAVCGDGGSLIICDGCEGEYHMECLRPRLKTVPEGHWECDECVDRKLLKAQESLLSKTRLFEFRLANTQGNVQGKSNSAGDTSFSREPNMHPSSPVVAAFKAFAAGIEAIFNAAAAHTASDSDVELSVKTDDSQSPNEHNTGLEAVFDAAARTGLDNDGDIPVKTEDIHPSFEHVAALEAGNDVAVLTRLDKDGDYPFKTEAIEPPIEHTDGLKPVVEAATTTKLEYDDDLHVKQEETQPPTDHTAGLKAVFDAAVVSGMHDDVDHLVKTEDIEPPIEHTAGVMAALEATALTGLENDGDVPVKTEEVQLSIENTVAMSGLDNDGDVRVKTDEIQPSIALTARLEAGFDTATLSRLDNEDDFAVSTEFPNAT